MYNLIQTFKRDVHEHVESVPRIKSYYFRTETTKQFIYGWKSLADLHRDYVILCKEQNFQFAKINMYSRIFDKEYNISFYIPKKDQYSQCEVYKNSDDVQ